MPTPTEQKFKKGASPYTQDWPIIAFNAKKAVNWTCQRCPSCPPDYPADKISVHHIDLNPQNNDPSNLIVLCAGCHLGMHRYFLLRRNRIDRLQLLINAGQLSLPGFALLG